MAHTFSSVKDFLDHQHRHSYLDATDMASANIAENGDCILTVRVSESRQEDDIVDTSKLAPQDIERLKAEDPFLYYSIQNKRRKRSCCDFDYDCFASDNADTSNEGVSVEINVDDCYSEVDVRRGASSSSSDHILSLVAFRRTSMPNLVSSSSNPRQTRRHSTIVNTDIVKRQRRLSTESHPCLMYESLFDKFDLGGPDIILDNDEEE
ncbi:hypothetical protein ACHAW6_010434 [Cyclotella cf. meneghiniana]